MKALFFVESPHEDKMPEIETLAYLGPDGLRRGGWYIAPETEAPTVNTVAIVIDATDAVLDVLADDPNLFYVDEIDDQEPTL